MVRVAMILFCCIIAAPAFQFSLRKKLSIVKHPHQLTWGQPIQLAQTQLNPRSTCGMGEHQLKHNVGRFVGPQHHLVSKPSALFSVSTSTSNKGRNNGILARICKLLFFPLRFFILNPLKLLAEFVVDDLDPDGTVAVSNDTSTIDIAVPNAAGDLSVKTTLPSATVEIQSIQDNSSAPASRKDEAVADATTILSSEPLAPSSSKVASSSKSTMSTRPAGDRWAIAAPGIDLSGHWEVIATDEFKHEYDQYLAALGQPLLVRTVAMGIIVQTTEETKQTDNGKSLLIRGRNLRGIWDRTLVASGTDIGYDEYEPLQIPVMTADSEQVEAESWWEEEGTVHVSWLRGVSKYGGGSFESRRYIDDNGDTYVCEGTFHPDDNTKQPLSLTWRFRRQVT